MPRLFVAIDLPWETRRTLAAMTGGVPGARWMDEERIHLTLRFIGEVDYGLAEDIDAALQRISVDAFSVDISGLGLFDRGGEPTALWAGVKDSPPLKHLQAKIESTLVRVGLPPETKKFKPHVTLARLKHPALDRLQAYMVNHSPFSLPPFQVHGFTLFSSQLSRNGSIYTPESVYPLRRIEIDAEPLAAIA